MVAISETSRTSFSSSNFPSCSSRYSSSNDRSQWSSMVRLPRPVMIRMSSSPAFTACSTTNWMAGLSTIGSISLGWDFVAGRNRVPSPAAGITAFLMRMRSSRGRGELGVYPTRPPSNRPPGLVRLRSPDARTGIWYGRSVDAVAGAVRSPVRREAGKLLVPVGITVTLIAVIGDLVAHTLDPLAHEHEELVVLSARGNSPWHLLLFAGILVTAVGAIRWANHLGSDWGNLLGAAMVLLLVAAVGLGTWAGWQARTPSVTLASGAGSQAAGAHVHTAAADAVPANARAGEAGSGAEGASITGHVHGTPGSVSPQESQILSRQIAGRSEERRV